MGAYRDDLQAARERIRSLEREVETLRARQELSFEQGTGTQKVPAHVADGIEVKQGSRLVPWIALILGAFLALRVPALGPLVVAVVLVMVLFEKLRARWVVARPHEVVAFRVGSAEPSDAGQPMPWFGPGRAVRVAWGKRAVQIPVGAEVVEGTVSQAVTSDGQVRDIGLLAVVVVRLDDNGLERAVARAAAGVTEARAAAWSDLEATVRSCAAVQRAEELDAQLGAFEQRVRQEADDALDAAGLVLLALGVRRAVPSASSVTALSGRIPA